ncbi:hypothetical protein [Pseudoxanthomonas sp. X-1]|uniref:hypothetical protein n=1 Tax=Pseudoxanthomonas sp. X-1 TaxID=2571115 RepID=UPI00110A6546|nr:hypothetical protein [Pseudoxanthomonas sp. X-1]TMN24525.1 hypothetical protein FF950_05450 [Pseudoxanthomonas sp. X-1]UAY75207.1 hypothetical protein LAJ50_02780 [Pseudoxanthomonas sp. X-1]
MKTNVVELSAQALATVGNLGAVGLKAIEYQLAVEARKQSAFEFGLACETWKAQQGIDFIPKNSPEWDQMLHGLPQLVRDKLWRAKADEKNARARLFRACLKARTA